MNWTEKQLSIHECNGGKNHHIDITLLLWVTPSSYRASGFFSPWAACPHPGPRLSVKHGPMVETKRSNPLCWTFWLDLKLNPESCLPASNSSPDWLCCCWVPLVMFNSGQLYGLQPTRLLCPWGSLGKSTGVGCHTLLQGIFLTRGLNLGLLHGRQILHHWVTREVPGWLCCC